MEVEDLKKQIFAANKAYRDGHPTMSDQAFDDLCDELEKSISNEEYAAFRDSLHEGKGKVKHPFIMGSLDKLKREEPEEVVKFVNSLGQDINVSAKVDGISCRASYKRGKLVAATTRGDGSFGENITDKAMHVNGLPHELKSNGSLVDEDLEIRGELVILKSDFITLNEVSNGKFANARNACAGIMNRKEWSEDEVKYVTFIPYTILGTEYTKEDQFKLLRRFDGMEVAWAVDVNVNSIKDINETLFGWASQEFDYETDGLVICSCGYTNEDKYRPDKCKAYKINQQIAETTLIDVAWEGPSKDGNFCPVGIVDPVELGGATISRVSLHNLDIIEQLGLMYGSRVVLKRSGDVIPHIDQVIGNSSNCQKIMPISECTCCGSTLVRDGINMRCVNGECPDQVVHRLVNFIKKLGVKSASNATLKNFGITSFDKLIDFKPNPKYKSEVKLYDELYVKVFSQSKEKLLGAMNFIGLSETLVGKIVSYYGIDVVEDEANFVSITKANALPNGIGYLTLNAFIEGLPNAIDNMHKIVNDVRWHWTPNTQGVSRNTVEVKGTICVTGSLKFGSRSKFLEYAKEHGYESKSGVAKGLTYLVNNDINSNSSKNRKAKELGIKIISEDEFMKIVNDNTIECNVMDL